MKLAENTIDITGNLQFEETVAMRIDVNAHSIILDNLIQMYSDPYGSVLREYSSNAWDAHRDADQTRPVEITLPSALSPNLTIRDWGVGMSRETLKNYGQFGHSDKRDTNDAIGGFGLGSKSGLAVAASFTVTSVKDGKLNTIVIGRDKNGAPSMGFLEEKDTDKPNGTTVTIPTAEVGKLRNAIIRGAFLGWKPGTLLIDGAAPEQSLYNPEFFEDLDGYGWIATDKFGDYQHAMVTVGVVTVPLDMSKVMDQDFNLSYGLLRNYLRAIILKLDNGSVELLRSREGLIYDKRTRKAIQAQIDKVVSVGAKTYQDRINKAETWRDAYKLQRSAQANGFDGPYTYKGEPLTFYAFPDIKDPATGKLLTQVETISMNYNDRAYVRDRFAEENYVKSLTLDEDPSRLILVTDAPDKIQVRKNSTDRMFPLSKVGRIFMKAASETKPQFYRSGTVVITPVKGTDLPEKLKEAFGVVLTHEAAFAEAETLRKTSLAEARRLSAANKAKSDSKTEFQHLNLQEGGTSYAHPAELEKFNTTVPTILIHTMTTDKFEENLGRALLYKVAYRDMPKSFRQLTNLVVEWANSGLLQAIFVRKSDNETLLRNTLNVVDPKVAIQALFDSQTPKITPAQAGAAQDTLHTSLNWVSRLGVLGAAQVKDPSTKAWLAALTDTKTKASFDRARELNEIATGNSFTTPVSTADTTGYVSHRTFYPLLNTISYGYPDPVFMAQYINLVDHDRNNGGQFTTNV